MSWDTAQSRADSNSIIDMASMLMPSGNHKWKFLVTQIHQAEFVVPLTMLPVYTVMPNDATCKQGNGIIALETLQ